MKKIAGIVAFLSVVCVIAGCSCKCENEPIENTLNSDNNEELLGNDDCAGK